jgi:Family of unknown function (DUF6011)
MTIRARFNSRCTRCNGFVNIGDNVEWTRGVRGVYHTVCPAQPVQPVRPQPMNNQPLPDVPAGRYAIEVDGVLKFYHVDKPTEGRWVGYTFVSVRASDTKYPVRGMDQKRAVLNAIIAAGVQEATERFGRELGICGICGRSLTDDESRARGIGPICAALRGYVAAPNPAFVNRPAVNPAEYHDIEE